MSYVTHMTVYLAFSDPCGITDLNRLCARIDAENEPSFTPTSGNCHTSSDFTMTANHFPHWELVEQFPEIEWRHPGSTILLIDAEGEDRTQVVTGDGRSC